MSLRGSSSTGALEEVLAASGIELGALIFDCDLRGGGGLLLSFLSSSEESFFSPLGFPMSKVAPGVLGVFALPKLKAPPPRPKAEDPVLVGEAIDPGEKGLFLILPLEELNRRAFGRPVCYRQKTESLSILSKTQT